MIIELLFRFYSRVFQRVSHCFENKKLTFTDHSSIFRVNIKAEILKWTVYYDNAERASFFWNIQINVHFKKISCSDNFKFNIFYLC